MYRPSPDTCVICDNQVKGRVHGIQPKFCCGECCANFVGTKSKHYNRRLVSVSRALYHYNCTARDLEVLNFKTQKNPIDEQGRPMRLFLGAEVDYLMDLKVEAIRRETMVQSVIEYVGEKLAIESRKQRLENILDVKLGELDAVERSYLLGDYLLYSSGTKTTLQDVQKRFSVLDRARAIRLEIPDAHPGAVFDFCVTYPEKGPVEYTDLQRRCQKVFFTVGELIVDKLSDEDKTKLETLSLMETLPPRMSLPQATIYWYLNHSDFAGDCLQISARGGPAAPPCLLKISRGRRTDTPDSL